MALSAFADKAHPPRPAELAKALGKAASLWTDLVARLGTRLGGVSEVWGYSSAKYGWSVRVKQGERVVMYLTPQDGQFLAGIVLGEKAARAAHEAELPAAALALVDAAPRYAEGRGIRTAVATRQDMLIALALATVKMET